MDLWGKVTSCTCFAVLMIRITLVSHQIFQNGFLNMNRGCYPQLTLTLVDQYNLFGQENFPLMRKHLLFERQIKGWSRAKKIALIDWDWDKIHQIVKDERKRRESKKRNDDSR